MKKTIAVVLALVLCLGILAGCGSKKTEDKTITVAASPTPHAEILKVAADVLAKDGYTLKVTEYSDYVVPNNVVEDGELDANYFQHQPYLDTFNAENGTHLVSVAAVHYEPFGIYPGTKSAIADLAKGDKIAIPNDGSNRARALLLLEANGVIKLKEGVGMQATVLDGSRPDRRCPCFRGAGVYQRHLRPERRPERGYRRHCHRGCRLCLRSDLRQHSGGEGRQREYR